jgi:proliferating cell nuclear antigen PCNA
MKRQLEEKKNEDGEPHPKRHKVDGVRWRIRMKPATRFCEMIDSVSKLNVNEARIQITKTGMRLGCLDSAHVATVLVAIHSEADTVLEYQTDGDEDGQVLDVSIPSLSKLCKVFLNRKTEGTVTLEAYHNKAGYVLMFEDKGLVRFELNELDLQCDETAYERPDSYEPDCVVALPGSMWKEKIKEMDDFGGDTIYLSATAEFGLRLQCKCGEAGSVDMKMPIGEQVTSVKLKPNVIVEGIPMSLKYLKYFASGAGIDGRPVELHLNVGIPLVMKVLLDDTGSFKEYMLAPKAQTHDEEEEKSPTPTATA